MRIPGAGKLLDCVELPGLCDGRVTHSSARASPGWKRVRQIVKDRAQAEPGGQTLAVTE